MLCSAANDYGCGAIPNKYIIINNNYDTFSRNIYVFE